MKKILKIIFIILLIILIKLILSFSINEIIILNYNNKVYNKTLIKILYILNFNQPYIAYYNEGKDRLGGLFYMQKKLCNDLKVPSEL